MENYKNHHFCSVMIHDKNPESGSEILAELLENCWEIVFKERCGAAIYVFLARHDQHGKPPIRPSVDSY